MLTYRLEPADRVVVISGPPSDQVTELQHLLRRVFADPNYEPGFAFLRDRRGLTALTAEQAANGGMVADDYPTLRGSRWAIVTDSEVDYGASRAWQAIGEAHGLAVQVFRDTGAAMAWLGSHRTGQT